MNKTTTRTTTAAGIAAALALSLAFAGGCGRPGKEGDGLTDCGGHGTLHDGHCHCDSGYLFDGTTCLAPEQITEICGEHVEVGDAGTAGEHHDEACRCPAAGECPCDEGTVETFGTDDFCVPALDE